ncbi:MAG: N-acetyltransferase [Phycisphaeraceae bacterium]|nr:MAG: N-acetyltransferase [Phycisphaeraceae bacterium]
MPPVDLQPHLIGDLIELRPLAPEDWPELSAVASDPLIWEQHPARDRHVESVFRIYFDGALASRGAFAVIERDTGRIIGSTRFHGHDPERSEIEIGWTFLARRCWGGRHNAEMKRLLLDHAFVFVTTVIFVVGVDNIRSQKAVERLGAAPREIVERPDRLGRPLRNFVYALERTQWRRPA